MIMNEYCGKNSRDKNIERNETLISFTYGCGRGATKHMGMIEKHMGMIEKHMGMIESIIVCARQLQKIEIKVCAR